VGIMRIGRNSASWIESDKCIFFGAQRACSNAGPLFLLWENIIFFYAKKSVSQTIWHIQ